MLPLAVALLFAFPSMDLGQSSEVAKDEPQLKALVLPVLDGSEPDKPTLPRVIVEVTADGSVCVDGSAYLDADDKDPWKHVEAALAKASSTWDLIESHPTTADGASLWVRQGRVVIRCDGSAPFSAIQQVMSLGASLMQPIAGFDFACRDHSKVEAALLAGGPAPGPTDKWVNVVHYDLPMADGPVDSSAEPKIPVVIQVRKAGQRVDPLTQKPWTPDEGTGFGYSLDRKLDYLIGPKAFSDFEGLEPALIALGKRHKKFTPKEPVTALINAGTGVTCGEALSVLQALRVGAQADQVTFTGPTK